MHLLPLHITSIRCSYFVCFLQSDLLEAVKWIDANQSITSVHSTARRRSLGDRKALETRETI